MKLLSKNPRIVQWLVLVLILAGAAFLVYNRVNDTEDYSYGLNSLADQTPGKEDFSGITAQLLNAANEYKKATPEAKLALERNLIDLAMTRRDAMHRALEKNPRAIARAAIPDGLAKQLPSEINRYIEKQVRAEGTAEVIVTDYKNKENHPEAVEYFITDSRSKTKYQIRSKDLPGNITTGTKLRVNGFALDTNLVPEDSNSSVVVTSQATATALTERKVAVILINFQDIQTTPHTHDGIRSVTFTAANSVNAYFKENSYNKLGLTGHLRPDGDVFGYYTIPYTSANCSADYSKWGTAADQLAARDGFSPNNYHSIIYTFPGGNSCSFTGKANAGGLPARVWINAWHELGVVAHELGHNLNFFHASRMNCVDGSGSPVPYSATCTNHEYGDGGDIMGAAGQYHFSNYLKGKTVAYPTGWLPTSNVVTLASGQSGTYTLIPQEMAASGIQTIRIPTFYYRPGSVTARPGFYYLEFRQPYGFDNFPSNSPILNGVTIRLAPDYNGSDNSFLIDTTPATPSFYTLDFPLTSGQTYTDNENGISITTQSVSPAGAVVSITSRAVNCVRQKPSISIAPISVNATAGQTVTYNVTVRNNDSADCPATTIGVSRVSYNDATSSWFYTPANSQQVVLSPGGSATHALNVTSLATSVAGTYKLSWSASNFADFGLGSSQADAQYIIGGGGGTPGGDPQPTDTTAPTVTLTAPSNGAQVKGKSTVTMTANASDNVGVSQVAFYVNGVVVCTDTTAPYSCNWKVPAGKKTHTLQAIARDAALNSGVSQTVTITSK